MFGNTLYVLTVLAYLALAAINLYKPSATGERLMAWGFIIFGVMAAYVLCSLLLTINLAGNGKLDWISGIKTNRNILAGFGFLCLSYGVVFVTMVNTDTNGADTANWLGRLMIQYGAIWMPLLMLIPYAMLLKTDGQSAYLPNLYKIPLLAGCLIGLFFYVAGRSQLGALFTDKQAVIEKKYQESMSHIAFTDDTAGLLYYIQSDQDPRVRDAALTKLKAKKDLETELLGVLGEYEQNVYYVSVIAYLEDNQLEHPERFVEPLKLIIDRMAEELKYRLQSFGSEGGFLELLNVDGLCRVLDTRFKQYNADFRPNMLTMYAALEPEPKPDFLAIRNRYKEAVKRWLDSN